jgi:hypothetical protein
VKDALTLDVLKNLAENGTDVLRPPVDFVTGLETVILNDEQERRVRMGQQIEIAQSFTSPEIAALDVSGQLVAILQPRGQLWKPELVLPDSSEGKLDS